MMLATSARRMLVVGLCVMGLAAAAAAEPVVLHVAPGGNDAWSGRLATPNAGRTDGPLASLPRAIEALKTLKAAGLPAGGVTVEIHAGTYEHATTLALGAEVAGTAEAPVRIHAATGDRVLVVGGRRVTAWQPAGNGLVRADLAALGLAKRRPKLLVCAGQRMPEARYPNFDPSNPYGGGWAFADGKPVPMYEDIPDEPRNRLAYREKDARQWARPREVEVFVFPRYNWWNNIVAIDRIDPQSRAITLQGDCSYPIRPGDRYYFRNAREELDAPGEWYVDVETSTLLFQPPRPGAEREVVVPVLDDLIRLDPGAAHLTIAGLVMECAGGSAVVMNRATDCRLEGCTIRNVGDYHHAAVGINGGERNVVYGCDIHDVGSHGVYLDGGDRVTLTPASNGVENAYIHHVGLEYKQGVGVALNGVGNFVKRSLIHDGPRMGVMFSGNNLLIEGNEIRHMNLETEDTGAVYTGGRDWISSRGTVIRHNRFHDILGFGKDEKGQWVSPHFAWGVYLDDNTGGVDVIGNLVYRCSRAGLHLHNGRDNRVMNNIFVENGLHQHEYNGWTGDHSFWKSHYSTMVEGYEKVAGQPAWRTMRRMDLHPRDAILPGGLIMSGNEVVRNIFAWQGGQADLVSVRNFPFDANTIDRNVVWHGGRPIGTSESIAGPAVSANLVANAGFASGNEGELPADWQWQIRTARARATRRVEDGNPVLAIEPALEPEKPRDNYPIVVGREFDAAPGRSYRISARMKASQPGTKANLMIQGYEANVYFWANWPNEATVATDWQPVQFVFTIPGPGQPNHHPRMGKFRPRVDLPQNQGTLFVDDVVVEEIRMLDGWESWQARGMDRNSLVANPGFVDPARDDYRLAPGSPALKLGFEPIPVDRIGPHADPRRASWPIVEAPGAREHPVKVPRQ
jgi:parallel beta-helix repeat protein